MRTITWEEYRKKWIPENTRVTTIALIFGVHRNTIANWDNTGPGDPLAKALLYLTSILVNNPKVAADVDELFKISQEFESIFPQVEALRKSGDVRVMNTLIYNFRAATNSLLAGVLDEELDFPFPQTEAELQVILGLETHDGDATAFKAIGA